MEPDDVWSKRVREVLEEMAVRAFELYPENPPKLSEAIADPDEYPTLETDVAYLSCRWWLSGAAEALGVTLLTMLEDAGLGEDEIDKLGDHEQPCERRPCPVCDRRAPVTLANRQERKRRRRRKRRAK